MGSLAFLAGVVEAACVTRYRCASAKHDSCVKMCSDMLTGGAPGVALPGYVNMMTGNTALWMSWHPLPPFCVRETRL